MSTAVRSIVQEKRGRGWQSAHPLAQLYKLFGGSSQVYAGRMAVEPATRVAVLGLYRSGSTAVAGVLHHLGVEMGAPFFHNFYESAWLSQKLRLWWNEPEIAEMTAPSKRVRILKRWIRKQEVKGSKWVGMKHPLLSLCGPDICSAWGPSVRFIWSCRPLEKSIKSLQKLNWWSGSKSEQVQQALWSATTNFFDQQEHLRIDFAPMMADPRREVLRLIEYLNLKPTAEQIASATSYIQPTSKE